jgi:hypothetical protein
MQERLDVFRGGKEMQSAAMMHPEPSAGRAWHTRGPAARCRTLRSDRPPASPPQTRLLARQLDDAVAAEDFELAAVLRCAPRWTPRTDRTRRVP